MSTSPIQNQLTELQTEAVEAIADSPSLDELEQLRVKYLGKKRSAFPDFARNGQIKSRRTSCSWFSRK